MSTAETRAETARALRVEAGALLDDTGLLELLAGALRQRSRSPAAPATT